MNTPLSSKDWETLSAYLDGQLSERDQTRLKQRMTADPELRRSLEELRQTKIMLRSVRRRRAPRNFTLSPQMVPQRRRSWLQPVPTFSFASGLATVLLILTLAFQYLPGLQGLREAASPNSLAAQAPAAAPLAAPSTASKSFDTQPLSESAPPVIIWNFPQGMGGGGSPETPAASGMGGGPGGTEIIVPGVDATTAPPIDMTTAPTTEPPAEPTTEPTVGPQALAGVQGPTPAPTAVPTLSGSGPILGIQPTQPAGEATTQPAGASEQTLSNQVDRYAINAPAAGQAINLGGIQIGLALLALGLAGAAIYFRRRS